MLSMESSCTAGIEERPSASTDPRKGEQNTQKRAQGCPCRGLQQSSTAPRPQHTRLQARICPFPSRVGKISAPHPPQLQPKPACILPAREMGPGRGQAGPEASHTIPTRKDPRPQKKSQQPLGIFSFVVVAFHILSSFTFS